MSTKNTPIAIAVEVATEEQLGHILDQQKRRMRGRGLTKDEANVIIRNGNRFLPVMDKAADVLIDQVRSEMANTIVRSFKVDRARSPQVALDATGRKQYVNGDIVVTMPTKGLTEGEMVFFKPQIKFSSKSPYKIQGAVAWMANRTFLTFNEWNDKRNVNCNRNNDDWNDNWSFGGVRKLLWIKNSSFN